MALCQFVFLSFIILLSAFPTVFAISCPPGKFIKERRCVPCPPGTYQENANSTSCDLCSDGHYNRFPGARDYSQCLACSYGFFAKQGATKCTKCPPGTFSRKEYPKCVPTCPAGKALRDFFYHGAPCRKCPPAWYRPAGIPSTICKFCPSGTGSKRGATKCKKCAKGTYRDKQFIGLDGRNSMIECRVCPKHTFADVEGSVQCKLCPLGTIAEERGAHKCTSCPPGTFRAGIKQRSCKPCPKGTTSIGKKPAGCKHPKKGCPVNTFEDKHGECRACMPGEKLNVRWKKCVPCGRREISLGGVTTECKACPPGLRPANSNTIFEKSRCECEDGTVSDGAGGCRMCPAGTRWDNRPAGAIWYTFTRVNYYRDHNCEDCPEGFFSDKPGMKECKSCPDGTYTNILGSTRCMPCPSGFVSPATDVIDKYVDYSGVRGDCISERRGCGIGQRRDKHGSCVDKVCKPNTVLSEECSTCWYNQFVNSEGRCEDCPEGGSNPRGAFKTCIVCPKGATDYTGRCVCTGLFEDNAKGGCRKCPPGELSTDGKCAPCGEDSYFRIRRDGSAECKRCEGNTIKLREGHRRCTKCPKGFKKERDVYGQEVNRCIPKDLYPVSTEN